MFAASIYAHIGKIDKAIDLNLTSVVALFDVTDIGIAVTLQEVRLNPWWGPPRGQTRFQKIMFGNFRRQLIEVFP